MADYLSGVKTKPERLQRCERYATVLLSGTVARFVGIETYLGGLRGWAEAARLERAYRAEACECLERETDLAFATIHGWLQARNDGHTMRTFVQLWNRALRLLRTPGAKTATAAIANALLQQKELNTDQIQRILSRRTA